MLSKTTFYEDENVLSLYYSMHRHLDLCCSAHRGLRVQVWMVKLLMS